MSVEKPSNENTGEISDTPSETIIQKVIAKYEDGNSFEKLIILLSIFYISLLIVSVPFGFLTQGSSFGFIGSILNLGTWYVYFLVLFGISFLVYNSVNDTYLGNTIFKKRGIFTKVLIISVLTIMALDFMFILYQIIFRTDKSGVISLNLTSIFKNTMVWGTLFLAIAVGLTLTYLLLNFPNFAHAEYLVVGGYSAIFVASTKYFQPGEPLAITVLFVGLLAGFLMGGLTAVISDVVVFRPLRKKGASIDTIMISSLGLSLILRGLLLLRFTNDFIAFTYYDAHPQLDKLRGGIDVPTLKFRVQLGTDLSFKIENFEYGTFGIDYIEIIAVVTTLLLVLGSYQLINRTKIGKAMRATADNSDLASASGINVEGINKFAAFLSGGLAGIAGVFYAGLFLAFRPETGLIFLLPAFAVIILGTVGSLRGAVYASYIMGFGRAISEPILSGLAFPLERRALTSFRVAVPYILLIVILIFFDEGIGKKLDERDKRNLLIKEGLLDPLTDEAIPQDGGI